MSSNSCVSYTLESKPTMIMENQKVLSTTELILNPRIIKILISLWKIISTQWRVLRVCVIITPSCKCTYNCSNDKNHYTSSHNFVPETTKALHSPEQLLLTICLSVVRLRIDSVRMLGDALALSDLFALRHVQNNIVIFTLKSPEFLSPLIWVCHK